MVVADGMVKGAGEFHEAVEEGEPRGLDVGVQAVGAISDAAGSGVLDQGDGLREEGVGALVESVAELKNAGGLLCRADNGALHPRPGRAPDANAAATSARAVPAHPTGRLVGQLRA